MENILSILLPYILTATVSIFATYFATVHDLKIRVTVVEKRQEKIEEDIAKQDAKLDQVTSILSSIKADISSIKTTLKILHHEEID